VNFVKIPGRHFEMQTTQVTQKQWVDVMGNNPSYFKGDDLPVERVSFYDVEDFIKKLNDQQSDWVYRFPTEDEWLSCCIEEKDLNEEAVLEYAWCDENSNGTTHPVGLKKPNSLGLYDMIGNVWEWNSTIIVGSNRGLRGGSWYSGARGCRVARRGWAIPSARSEFVGFRLARTALSFALLPSNPLSDPHAIKTRKLIGQIRAKLTKLEKLYE
jgi:formylglycine-generating enzyme required for sulfatase activity